MAMKMPLLSVALLLYRSNYQAKRALLSAALPALYSSAEVELLILDNNPGADRSLVKKLERDNIRYLPNYPNVGAMGSIIRAWQEARGDYFLLLGDDDFLDCFFIEKILESGELIGTGNCDIVASSPTEFEEPGVIRRLARSKQDCDLMSSPRSPHRSTTCGHFRYLNYLFYSIIRKDRVMLDTAFSYWAYCPGYITFLDWPIADGYVLCHQIKQLSYGYFVYNRQNWPTVTTEKETSWASRELKIFKSGLFKGYMKSMPDQQGAILKKIHMAAVATGYFRHLGMHYLNKQAGFVLKDFLEGASLVLKQCYVAGISIKGQPLSEACIPSFEALEDIIKYLCIPLREHLTYGEDLAKFLLTDCATTEKRDLEVLIDACRQRAGA